MKYILLILILLSLFQVTWDKQTILVKSPTGAELVEKHTFSIGWRW